MPKKLIQHALIKNEILFVGLGPTFQMWNPEKYKKIKQLTFKKAGGKEIKPAFKTNSKRSLNRSNYDTSSENAIK